MAKRFTRRIIVDGIRVEGPEARRIVHEAMRDPEGFPWGFVASLLVVGGAASGITALALTTLLPLTRRFWVGVVCAVVSFVVAIAWTHLYLRQRRRRFRAAMRRRGYELCESCGYGQVGLDPDARVCPECGAPVTPASVDEGGRNPVTGTHSGSAETR